MAAISAMFPFHEKFLERVKDFVETAEDFDQRVNSNAEVKEEIYTLHDIQQVCIKNLKTMLYLEKAGLLYQRCEGLAHSSGDCCSIAKTLNDEVLVSMPDNFNALWNKIILLETTGDEANEEYDDIMGRLRRVIEDNRLMLVAKAEVAGMYTYLGMDSESILTSVCLYEEVLDQLGTVTCETLPHPILGLDRFIVFWKQDLLWNYKLLTFKQEHDRAFSEARSLAAYLDQSPIVDNRLKAKAWANLALIYEHHIPTYQNRWPAEKANAKQRIREIFAKAMDLDPNNARISMLAARELRKREQGKSSQLKAIEWFQRSLEGEDVEDIRGSTLFHMGLTFRQLWIATDNYPRYDVAVNAKLISEANMRSNHINYVARVIKPPVQPSDFKFIPPPYKTPDENTSVSWRFLNPIANDRNNQYLLEARRCLQEASEVEDQRCLSLIELTRIHLSIGDIAVARACLHRAAKDPWSDLVSFDSFGVSLHENMAFLEESEMMRTGFNDVEAEKIKSLYRESIRQSTQSGWQPVVAFHCLLALLYKQLETRDHKHLEEGVQADDHMLLQNEYFLLYMAIQSAGESRKIVKSFTSIQEAKDNREIVNSFATGDFRIALMWRLIEMFIGRNQEYDAAAAFTYLSILVVDNVLEKEVNDVNLTSVAVHTKQLRMLLQVAERVARQRVIAVETRYLLPEYRELCDLCDAQRESESVTNSESLTDDEKRKLNIVMKIIKPELPTYCFSTKERV